MTKKNEARSSPNKTLCFSAGRVIALRNLFMAAIVPIINLQRTLKNATKSQLHLRDHFCKQFLQLPLKIISSILYPSTLIGSISFRHSIALHSLHIKCACGDS